MERLVTALGDFLASVLERLSAGEPVIYRRSTGAEEALKVETSLRISTLAEAARPLERPRVEPLIDVIRGKGEVRVVVLLPGIDKEDVSTRFEDGNLLLRIQKGSTVFQRKIPCRIPGGKVRVRSKSAKNSVVELVFGRGGK